MLYVFSKSRNFVPMNKWLFPLLVVFCLWTLPLRAQQEESNLADAVSLYTSGEYTRALRVLEPLSVAAPRNDAVWYYLGLSHLALKQPDKALENLRKAVQLDGGNYWYRNTLARLCLVQGQTQEGLELYQALRKDFPDKESVAYELLDIYFKLQRWEDALAELERIERRVGTSEEMVRTRYDLLTAMGKQEEGVEALEQFNASYSSVPVLSMLGDYYLAEYRDSLAQARYAEALSLDSDYVPAILGMSETYRHGRKYNEYFGLLNRFFCSQTAPAEAKGMYLRNLTQSIDPKILQLHQDGYDSLARKAAALHPADSTLLGSVAAYFYSTGRTQEAGVWFKALAERFPESLSSTATYVQYLVMTERWEEVRDRSLAAFKRFQELGFLDYANAANFHLSDYDAIIGNARFVLEHFPKEKTLCLGAWSMMGDAYHAKGDSKSAFRCYDQALKLDPGYAPVLNNYAYYLSEQGRKLKKAYAMSKKTIEAEPDNATFLDTFAWILHLMGKDLEAKPFFKHAMLYGGKDSAVMLDHYAEVLYALGEYDMARSYWRQAKAKNLSGEVPDLDARVKARLDALNK